MTGTCEALGVCSHLPCSKNGPRFKSNEETLGTVCWYIYINLLNLFEVVRFEPNYLSYYQQKKAFEFSSCQYVTTKAKIQICSVCIVTSYGLEGRELNARQEQETSLFSRSRASSLILEPIQSHINSVRGSLSPRGKVAGAWSLPLPSTQFRSQEWCTPTSTPSVRLYGLVLN